MMRECLVLWVSANDLLAGTYIGRFDLPHRRNGGNDQKLGVNSQDKLTRRALRERN